MYLKLNDFQFKTSRYRLTCMNSMVTTNQKCSVGTQDLEIKEQKHTTEEK